MNVSTFDNVTTVGLDDSVSSGWYAMISRKKILAL
jgi:hypothetical protein